MAALGHRAGHIAGAGGRFGRERAFSADCCELLRPRGEASGLVGALRVEESTTTRTLSLMKVPSSPLQQPQRTTRFMIEELCHLTRFTPQFSHAAGSSTKYVTLSRSAGNIWRIDVLELHLPVLSGQYFLFGFP